MIRISVLLFLWMVPLVAVSQDQSEDIPTDTSEITVRTIDAETVQDLSNTRDFEYNELPENPDTLWSRIRAWLFDLLGKIFQSKWASIFIRVVFVGIFAVVLIAVINQILGGNLTSSFSGKKSEKGFRLNISEESLHQKDYETWLKSALDQKNYKDAVRILYLTALQDLTKAGLISWKADKTNSDYLRELASHPARSSFSRLTYFYEYVEYGDFRIDEEGFEKFQKIYQTLEIQN